MTHIQLFKKWLRTPPLTGGRAIVAAVAAVALPTLIRESVDGVVSGVGFTPYLPFVLLSAVLAGWRHATLVALVSATIADLLFVGPAYQLLEGPSDVFGFITFLVSSALIIVLVQVFRSLAEDWSRPDSAGGIIFSVEGGHAWASWSDAGSVVRLGAQDEVAEMMQDFLAQLELGKRLNGQQPRS
ncbi:MAG: DUF4118 domain-containing protein [Allosphingosinicella sp.]